MGILVVQEPTGVVILGRRRQRFECVGTGRQLDKDGNEIQVAFWKTNCPVCENEFEITTLPPEHYLGSRRYCRTHPRGKGIAA